jgi:hypothetical protein
MKFVKNNKKLGDSNAEKEVRASLGCTRRSLMPLRDTTGLRTGRFRVRCGGRGLWVIARRSPAASDLVGIYEDVGTSAYALGTSIVPSFRFATSVSDGAAISAIRTPPGIIRSNGRSSRRSPPRRGTTVRLVKAYRKSVPPHTQRILASMKTCCGRCGPGGTPVRAASLRFELSMRGPAVSGGVPLSD